MVLIPSNPTQIENLIATNEPFILKFVTGWCHVCKQAEKILAEDDVTIYELDVEKYRDYAITFRVRTVPTFLAFPSKERLVGLGEPDQLKTWCQNALTASS